MWDDLHEDVQEEFQDLQPDFFNLAHLDRTVMEPDPAPYLSDEIDPQEWQKHIQLTTPLPNTYPTEPTCLCTYAHRRRWKNQYNEGTYLHVNTYMATKWSDQDLEEMTKLPCPEIPEGIQRREEKSQDVYPASNSQVRVQISMKQKGTDVKGRYENFEIHNIPLDEIFQVILTLLTHFPKQPRKHIHYYTRVQLQNKISGKMQGGRNLSLHNATPEEVASLLEEIFDANGWISPRPGAQGKQVTSQKESPFQSDQRSQSEDDAPKPENHSSLRRGRGGLLYQSKKSAKVRATLLAEIEAMIGAVA